VKVLICLCGLPGSGKSLISKAGEELNIPVIVMGDYVRKEAKKRYGVINSETTRKTMIELREELGPEAVAKLMAEDVKKLDSKVVIIDGVRSIYEINFLRQEGYRVIVIFVYASTKKRFGRIVGRGRIDDTRDLSDFFEREIKEVKVGLKDALCLADYVFVNEELSKEEALSMFKKLINEIMHLEGIKL